MGIKGIKHVELRRVKEVIDGLKPITDFEVVDVEEAYGRVLAENIRAPIQHPLRDMAHFDGYAVRYDEVKGATPSKSLKLKVVGEVFANEFKEIKVGVGEAVHVATGAFLPPNADTVIPVESVKHVEGFIEIRQAPPRRGWHVIPGGDDFKVGDLILTKGRVLRPIDIELLKFLGIDRVKVIRRLKVSVISIGDELVLSRADLREGKKLSTRSLLVKGFLRGLGVEVADLGVVSDDPKEIGELIKYALSLSDVVVTIGSASVGKKDVVHEVINGLGEPGVLFHGVRVKPGRQSGLALVGKTPIVMLPGLIQSTYVGMHVVLAPLISRLYGNPWREFSYVVKAVPQHDFYVKEFAGFPRIVFAEVVGIDGGCLKVVPYIKESPLYTPLIKGDVALIIPPRKINIKAGEVVIGIPTSVSDWLNPILKLIS